jgi:hypothetical protein
MKRLIAISVCTFLGAIMFCSLATSQTLDEWKAAQEAMKAERGCDSIPYSNYKDACREHQAIVNENCGKDDNGDDRIGTPWNCNQLGTRALREEIKGMSEKVESLKGEKDHVSNDSDKTESLQRQIDNLSKEVEFRQKSLETDIRDIEIRLDKGRRCIDARKEVQYAFKSARSNASSVSEGEQGEIAKELVEYWERRDDGHEKAIENVRGGIEKCEKCKSGDL